MKTTALRSGPAMEALQPLLHAKMSEPLIIEKVCMPTPSGTTASRAAGKSGCWNIIDE